MGIGGQGSEVSQDGTTPIPDPRPPTPVARRLAFNTAIVGAAFVVSRVLGLVREAVIAGRFGTSPEYDAYLVAFGIPDVIPETQLPSVNSSSIYVFALPD